MSPQNITTATTPRLDSSARWSDVGADRWQLLAGSWRHGCRSRRKAYIARNFNGLELIGSDSAPVIPVHPRPANARQSATRRLAYVTARSASTATGISAVIWASTSYNHAGLRDAELKEAVGPSDAGLHLRPGQHADLAVRGKESRPTAPPAPATRRPPPRSKGRCTAGRSASTTPTSSTGPSQARRDSPAVVVSPTRIDVNVPFCPPAVSISSRSAGFRVTNGSPLGLSP